MKILNKLLLLLGLALLAEGARADTLNLAEGGFTPSALKNSRNIFGYVPRLKRKETWASRQVRAMRARSSDRRYRAARAMQDEGAASARRRDRELSTSSGSNSLGSINLSNAIEESGGTDSVPLTGVSEGTSGMTIAFVATDVELARMVGVPDSAITVATAVIDLTDKATAAALSIQGLLARELNIDWTLFFKNTGTPREGDIAESGERKDHGGDTADEDSEKFVAVANRRRAVRSAFNIGLGLLIGILMWVVARKL